MKSCLSNVDARLCEILQYRSDDIGLAVTY